MWIKKELNSVTVDATEEKRPLTKLEQEFLAVEKVATEAIEEKLKEAMKLIREAEKLSEKHGIPFSGVSPVSGNSYFPKSFDKKWGDLDEDFLEEVEIWKPDFPGWEHSAIC